eukprot:TRINITY_DN502_c0_g1_i4.p1 TRINITY_DN502_c0_g1~~TRINITY_DN502_c0_g1_i4.p1  ORF type:complete len:146 (+),score=20.64 TRINITY_DN502_c0_g1_i4:145-582(+)
MDWIATHNGSDTRVSYPYTALNRTCASNPNTKCPGSHIKYAKSVTASDVTLEAEITLHPVAVSIFVNNNWKAYTKGVFNDPTCVSTYTNHAVVAVGEGNDETTSLDYYKVRNSWGTSWGEAGYIRMAAGVNMCLIASNPWVAVFP